VGDRGQPGPPRLAPKRAALSFHQRRGEPAPGRLGEDLEAFGFQAGSALESEAHAAGDRNVGADQQVS